MTELVTIKFRRGTTAEWTFTTSKLSSGEPGFDTTTGILKIGNGSSAWADLPAFKSGDGPIGPTGPTGADGVDGVMGPMGPTGADGEDGVDGEDGAMGPTGPTGITLTGIPNTTILVCDGLGGVTGSSEFTFSEENGVNLNTNVQTNRLVMAGYGGAYYSDDYGDSWIPCTGTVPGYAAACSASGVWIGANGVNVLTSTNGINWSSTGLALAGAYGNDNKYGIGFNGNTCVVATVTGNVGFCANVTANPQVWTTPAVQLIGINFQGVAWNATANVWWLFGTQSAGATIYTFDGTNTPAALTGLYDESDNPINFLFTGTDAWCMCGLKYNGNAWVIGGKGPDQNSSLALVSPRNPGATTWTVIYETTVTNGTRYLRSLASDGTDILGGHTGVAIIRSPILGLDQDSWTNYSKSYAEWVDLTYTGGYWFAGVGSPFNLGRCVAWSDNGIRWDLLYVGPGITTAYTLRASPGLIPGVATVLASSFNPERIGILTANPYTTLDVRGNIASYTQYMNVGASDNGLNIVKNNVANPAGGTFASAGVFSMDIPDQNVSVIEVVGAFKLTVPSGGTYGILRMNNLGQLLFNSYGPDGTGITGPITIA